MFFGANRSAILRVDPGEIVLMLTKIVPVLAPPITPPSPSATSSTCCELRRKTRMMSLSTGKVGYRSCRLRGRMRRHLLRPLAVDYQFEADLMQALHCVAFHRAKADDFQQSGSFFPRRYIQAASTSYLQRRSSGLDQDPRERTTYMLMAAGIASPITMGVMPTWAATNPISSGIAIWRKPDMARLSPMASLTLASGAYS